MHWNENNLNTILLVEDDPVHARIMRRALEDSSSNDQIIHLSDGESVLEQFIHEEDTAAALATPAQPADGLPDCDADEPNGRHMPNLILLDLRLPTVDGLEVLQALRGHARTRNIPVIIVSTSERQGDVRNCYSLGANAYITKPVDYNIFMEKLRALRDFWLVSAELPCDDEED